MNGAWPGRPPAPPPTKEFDEENITHTALAWEKTDAGHPLKGQ